MPYYDTSRYQIPHSPVVGAQFVYLTNTTFELHITDICGLGHVLVEDATRRQYLTFSADLPFNLATEGIGGMHPADHPAAVSSVYEVRAAWDPSSAELNGDFGLFAVAAGTVVNLALVQALTGPGDYSMWSPPLFVFITDGATHIRPFSLTSDGWITLGSGIQVLTAGKGAVWTAIDCADVVPNLLGCGVQLRFYASDTGIDAHNLQIGTYDGTTEHRIWYGGSIGNLAGCVQEKEGLIVTWNSHLPTDFLIYDWDVAPSYGLDVWVMALKVL